MAEHDADWRGKGPVTQPEYWNDPRFGKDRRGYPVVGISWYEAAAYAAWLKERLKVEGYRLQEWRSGQLVTLNLQPGTFAPRLPTDAEWLRLAGGEREGKKERYPWDVPGSGRITDAKPKQERQRSWRGETDESGIGGTSPVAMYPLGASKPHRLWDVAGNVWEWIGSWYDKEQTGRVLRGGSWDYCRGRARPGFRFRHNPDHSDGTSVFVWSPPLVLDPDSWGKEMTANLAGLTESFTGRRLVVRSIR